MLYTSKYVTGSLEQNDDCDGSNINNDLCLLNPLHISGIIWARLKNKFIIFKFSKLTFSLWFSHCALTWTLPACMLPLHTCCPGCSILGCSSLKWNFFYHPSYYLHDSIADIVFIHSNFKVESLSSFKNSFIQLILNLWRLW